MSKKRTYEGTVVCKQCCKEVPRKSTKHFFCSDSCRWKDSQNHSKRLVGRSKRRGERLDMIRAYKMEVGCEKCGYREHPAALEFDHLDPNIKLFNLSRGHLMSVDRIQEEMSKCRVLCANCHAIHTYNTFKENGKCLVQRTMFAT